MCLKNVSTAFSLEPCWKTLEIWLTLPYFSSIRHILAKIFYPEILFFKHFELKQPQLLCFSQNCSIWGHLLWIQWVTVTEIHKLSAAAAAAAAGPQQAWLWQPTLSRRNVHPHLQISFDSCKLREGWQEGGGAAIFVFHSARSKAEREGELPSLSCSLQKASVTSGASLACWRNFWRTEATRGDRCTIRAGDTNRCGSGRPTWLCCATTKAAASSMTLTRTWTVSPCWCLSVSGVSLGDSIF